MLMRRLAPAAAVLAALLAVSIPHALVAAAPDGAAPAPPPSGGPGTSPADAADRAHPVSKARIKIDEPVFDFGTAAHGSVVKHSFRIRNEGQEPLVIQFVKASCGCTAAQPAKSLLAPGESTTIEAAFDTAKKHPSRSKQRFSNTITVRHNDETDASGGAPGTSRLVMEGDVATRYQLIPDVGVAFANFARGAAEPPTATVEILPGVGTTPEEAAVPDLLLESEAGVPLTRAARVLATPPYVDVTSVTSITRDGRRGIALRVRARPTAPVGALDGVIRLSTGNPGQPELSVAVRGYVSPAVQAIPPKLVLPLDLGGSARPLRIMAPGSPRVLGVEVLPEGRGPAPLEAALGEPANNVIQVVVRAARAPTGAAAPSPDAAEAPVKGSAGVVLVYLSDPAHPVVAVPYLLRDLAAQASDLAAQRAAGVRVSPPEVYFGDVAPRIEVEGSVVILKSGAATGPIDVRDISIEPAGLLTPRLETLKAGEVQRLLLRLTPPGAGVFTARVRFRPREGGPELSVSVAGRTSPSVDVEPRALAMTPSRRFAETTLTRAGGGPIKVLAAESRVPGIVLEALPGDDGAARITARVEKADTPLAGLSGEAVILTDVPGAEEIRIPIRGFAAP